RLVAPDGSDHNRGVGEAALAEHRVDKLAVHRNVEGAFIPGNQLDLREVMAKLLHQDLGQRKGLWLIATFRAIGDGYLDQSLRHMASSMPHDPDGELEIMCVSKETVSHVRARRSRAGPARRPGYRRLWTPRAAPPLPA